MTRARRTVVTVGTFDGVHRGHQAILHQVKDCARRMGLEPVAYTFSFPPRFTTPGPYLITTERMKSILLRRYVVRIIPGEFTQVRDLSPQEFVNHVLIDALGARAVVIGENFRFGSGRAGDVLLLKELGKAYGFKLFVIPQVTVDGMPVSSTRIRALIRAGKVQEATALLGRPPVVAGIVVHGDRLGRRIGYPTANLSLPSTLLRPGPGIYLGYAAWSAGQGYGLVYSGSRPTMDGKEMRCEVYLLSSPIDELSGKEMEVHLLARLRDDRAFPSVEALAMQIAADVEAARSLIPAYPRPQPILFSSG